MLITLTSTRSRVAVLLVAGLATLILIVFLLPPVLLSFRGSPIRNPRFVVLNPFRDRAPERCAETFLIKMGSGECAEILPTLGGDSKRKEYVCEREVMYPLIWWSLTYRRDTDQESNLEYRFRRKNYAAEDTLFVWVEKHGDRWQVTGYRSVY